MKKTFITTFLLVTLLAFAGPVVYAQEFIKRVPLEKSRDMIIRDVSVSSWLVYDIYSDGVNEKNAFVMFTETGTTAQVMTLPDIIRQIYDFEIYGGMVYFAGENMNGVGIMGYFPVAGFPANTIQLCEVPTMRCFNKLEVAVFDQALHVFMTGDESQVGEHMVDAWNVGGGIWIFSISDTLETVKFFDDVAILTSKIVFSARKRGSHEGLLHYFSAPSLGYSIFPQTSSSLVLGPCTSGTILLDVAVGDTFTYVYRTTFNHDVSGTINGTLFIQHHTLGPTFSSDPHTTIDLSCESVTGQVELLTETSPVTHYELFTGTGPAPVPIMPIYGHTFSGEELHSVDGVNGMPNVYVAAGTETNYGNNDLSIYRYNRILWPTQGCTDTVSVTYDSPDYKVLNGEGKYIKGRNYIIEASEKECQTSEVPVTDECSTESSIRY